VKVQYGFLMGFFRLALFALFFFCESCSNSSRPVLPGQLRLAIAEDPSSLDPRKGGDVLSAHMQLMLFEGLVKLHPDGSITPAQCYSYEISKDGTVYTFHLGKTKWSDGSPVLASHFEKAWKDMLYPDFPSSNAHLLYPIKGAYDAKKGRIPVEKTRIYCKNSNTFVVELEAPTPHFLQLISFCVFSPVHPEIEKKGTSFISNGPFMLSKWLHDNEIVLEKNPYYFGEKEVGMDSIRLSIIKDEMTALQLYEKGEIDLIGSPFFTPPSEAPGRLPSEEVLTTPIAATTYITFNTESSLFSNKHLRQAFSLSVNRELLAEYGFDSKEKAASSAIPPCLVGENKKTFSLENTEEAKRLLTLALEELGIEKKELESRLLYLYPASRGEKKLAQIIQQQWLENLGIGVKIKSTERKLLLDALGKRSYFFAQITCRAQYCDPISILERFQTKENVKNYPSWEHPGYRDLLLIAGLESGAKRISTLEKAESLLIEEMPLSPIVHLNLHYLKKPHLKNVELSPAGGIFFERLCFETSLP